MLLFSVFFVFSFVSASQVALEVEQEEDEAGTIGDTFTDYVSADIFMYHWANFVGDLTSLALLVPLGSLRSHELLFIMKVLKYAIPFRPTLKDIVGIKGSMVWVTSKGMLQYVQKPSKLSIGQPHRDPIVETASLSAVQPPEPTYNLLIAEEMEKSGAYHVCNSRQ